MQAGFRDKAIELRRQGLSYSEVLKQVPVAKSTLSLWLQDVGLSKKQKQRLTEKKRQSALRGALSRKNWRIKSSKEIIEKAEREIGRLSERELWLIGIALYWAEGSKEKECTLKYTSMTLARTEFLKLLNFGRKLVVSRDQLFSIFISREVK